MNERILGGVAGETAGGTVGEWGTGICRSASLSELAKALALAQAELKNPPKDRVNPHFKSRYADLATVRDWVLPALNRQGLSVVQLPCEWSGRPALFTLLLHESGEYLGACLPLLLVKDDPQGMGSALTYARRYALQALVGVAGEEDDDGNSARGTVLRSRRSSNRREESRRRMLDYFQQIHGVTAEQVCQAVGVQRPEQIEEVHLQRLRGIAVALKSGQPACAFFPHISSPTANLPSASWPSPPEECRPRT